MWREANVFLMDISLKFIDKHDIGVREACAALSKYCSLFFMFCVLTSLTGAINFQ